jgi:hypothetical protein
MKTTRFVIVSMILVLAVFNTAIAQQNLFVWGEVKWTSGASAAGVEVRLMYGNQESARVYTNQGGRYFFFNVSGNPSNYSLVVVTGNIVRGQIAIPSSVGIGHRAPNLYIN